MNLQGAAGGAATGAKVGSIIPGVGTVLAGVLGGIGGALFGRKKKRRRPTDPMADTNTINRYAQEGEDSVRRLTEAMTSNAMPAFQQQLQGIRETATRRGVALGQLGTSYEGDLASSFQRNIANAIAGESRNNYETALDRFYGDKDRATANLNARRAGRSNMWGSLLGAAGTAAGAYLGRKG